MKRFIDLSLIQKGIINMQQVKKNEVRYIKLSMKPTTVLSLVYKVWSYKCSQINYSIVGQRDINDYEEISHFVEGKLYKNDS